MARSAFIQEWPANKLTVAQLRAVCEFLQNGELGDPESDLAIGQHKLEAALENVDSGPKKAEGPVYFFGCTKGIGSNDQAGHYLYVEGPDHDSVPREVAFEHRLGQGILPPSGMKIDGGFCPHYARDKRYAKAKLTHWGGWTAIGFWDSSGDTRPGSDSNFFMKGTLNFEDAISEARRVFGLVFDRCEEKYGPIECVQKVRIGVMP